MVVVIRLHVLVREIDDLDIQLQRNAINQLTRIPVAAGTRKQGYRARHGPNDELADGNIRAVMPVILTSAVTSQTWCLRTPQYLDSR